jgi:hypothetical protein
LKLILFLFLDCLKDDLDDLNRNHKNHQKSTNDDDKVNQKQLEK